MFYSSICIVGDPRCLRQNQIKNIGITKTFKLLQPIEKKKKTETKDETQAFSSISHFNQSVRQTIWIGFLDRSSCEQWK